MRDSQVRRYHEELLADERAIKYCLQRGLTYDIISEFFLGWCPPEDRFDVFKGRLLFPVFSAVGTPVAFQGRLVIEAKEEGRKQPKYLHTSAEKGFQKSHHFFGFKQAMETLKTANPRVLYYFEGPVEPCLAWKMGIAGVAALGSSFSQHQAVLAAFLSPFFVAATDSDVAGRSAAERAVEAMRSIGVKKSAKISLPKKDLGEMVEDYGFNTAKERFREAERDLIASVGWRADHLGFSMVKRP